MIRKKLYKTITVLLVFILCVCFVGTGIFPSANIAADDDETELLYSDTPVSSLRVSGLSPQVPTDMDYTDWWYSEWDDCRYIFLPATADRSALTITYDADGSDLYLNGTKIKSGSVTDLLSQADEFDVTAGNTDCGKLKVMQSELGCIYINTEHGGLDALDANRNLVETGNTLMLSADGTVQYSGELEKITSHGNSSWDYSQKKPYNIKLPSKANLYGMGKAKKWVLLGNYLDHSMLRNTVTTEMARTAGMEYVMDYTFVDLYADGSYRGTYQLSERVQVQKNRVNITDLEEETEDINDKELDEYSHLVSGASSLTQYIENSYKYYDIPNNPDDITGGYLLQFQLWNRYGGKASSGFVTSRGQAIQIDSPEYASKAQVEYIRSFVQDLEDAIYSDTGYNGKGKHYGEYIDVDSLIIAYLIQEISMNPDGTNTSFYLYKESDLKGDGKLHFGPAWDFDLAYCNFITSRSNSDGDIGFSYNPNNIFAACFPIDGYDTDLTDSSGSNRPTYGINWVGKLYKQDDFRKRAAQIYFESFEPYLRELTDTSQEDGALITRMSEAMRQSAEMNNARWHMYGGRPYKPLGPVNGNNYTECVEFIRDFTERRMQGLHDIWLPLVTPLRGDVNSDGEVSVVDVVMLQKYILGSGELTDPQAADLNETGSVNSFDLSLLRRLITEQLE